MKDQTKKEKEKEVSVRTEGIVEGKEGVNPKAGEGGGREEEMENEMEEKEGEEKKEVETEKK